MSLKIYCEGTKRSHDYDIIHKIAKDKAVHILPIGSKIGAESFIEDREKGADTFIFFRDRDFDVSVPNSPALTQQGFTFYSYRTTIENYLFDAEVFLAFLQKEKLNRRFKIKSLADVQHLFIQAAKKISYYQALRHTMARMRDSPDLGTSWLKGNSGSLPYPLNDKVRWRQKALEKLHETNVLSIEFTEGAFDAILETFSNRFEQDDFYQTAQYLIWFQGKDFAKSLSLMLPQFPMTRYYRFAKKYFDYTQFEDFVELRQIVDEMSISK